MYVTDNVMMLLAILLFAGVIMTKFSSRLGLPSLVFFIGVGMFLNRFIYFDDVNITQLFGVLALIIILFEGGMNTQWSSMRRVIAPSTSLATLGVILTSVIVGLAATYLLGLDIKTGMLLGAIVGSTDAAAVFLVLAGKNIKQRMKTTLEAESGSNDPMAIFLTVAIIQMIQVPDTGMLSLVISLFWQMGIGVIMGILIGRLAAWSINKINLDSSGLYPVFAVGFAIFAYSITALIQGSGMLAAYVMGVVFGNSDLTYRHSIFRFSEGFAWMMQIFVFILLGWLSFPEQVFAVTWQGLILSVILMFVARPVAVFLSTPFMKFTLREKLFVSWAGLKGVVPVVLATYPLVAGVEHGTLIFNVVFFIVITSALIQGSTIAPLAQLLGLTEGVKTKAPHSLELVSIGKTNSEIVEIEIDEGSYCEAKEIREIKLPEDSLISAIIRQDKVVTPRGSTKLLSGDILYILAPKAELENIKKLFLREELPEVEIS